MRLALKPPKRHWMGELREAESLFKWNPAGDSIKSVNLHGDALVKEKSRSDKG
jgi:hypothetical protein